MPENWLPANPCRGSDDDDLEREGPRDGVDHDPMTGSDGRCMGDIHSERDFSSPQAFLLSGSDG